MIKKAKILIAACFLMLASACSSQNQADAQQMQTFFTAFNHLMEAKTLYTKGTVRSGGFQAGFRLWIDQDGPLQIGFQTDPIMGNSVAFYLKDGRTYLDFTGTKSSSEAVNLGITEDTKLSLYNPLLNLTDQERAELFDSVTVDGEKYAFKFNRTKLSAAIDSFGSIKLAKADMYATVINNKITSLSFDMSGTITMGEAKTTFDGKITLNDIKLNEGVSIPYPSDLESWPVR